MSLPYSRWLAPASPSCSNHAIALLALATASAIFPAVDFKTQVQPILLKECAGCHGRIARRRVSIADRASVLKAGIVPGKPEASLFYKVLELPAGTPKAMPPGKQLPRQNAK